MFDGMETKSRANEGVEVPIMKADGDPSGVYITVLGQDSDVYTKLKDKHDRTRVKTIAKAGRAATDEVYAAAKENEMALTVACCAGWRHENGKPMPFDIGKDEDATVDFFKKYPLVYDQVRVAIHDRMTFTRASATKS